METATLQLRKCGTQRTDNKNVIELRQIDGNAVSIGRSIASTHTIINMYLSKVHAVLKWNGEVWTLEDLSSFNGTFINDARLSPHVPVRLSIGDEIGFGMPNSYRDGEDTLVYRLCRSDSVESTVQYDRAREYKQEVMLVDEATHCTSMEPRQNCVDCTRKPIKMLQPIIEINSDEDGFAPTNDIPLPTNIGAGAGSDSDYVACLTKRTAVHSDETDRESYYSSVNVKPKTKVTPMNRDDAMSCTMETSNVIYEISDDELSCDADFRGYSQEDVVITISEDEEEFPITCVETVKLEANQKDNDEDECFMAAEINAKIASAREANPPTDLSVKKHVNVNDEQDQEVANDFFPELSQSFYDSEEVNEQSSSKDTRHSLEPASTSKWFHQHSTNAETKKPFPIYRPQIFHKAAISFVTPHTTKQTVPAAKKMTLKQKVLQSMKHRIRIAGGGSDIKAKPTSLVPSKGSNSIAKVKCYDQDSSKFTLQPERSSVRTSLLTDVAPKSKLCSPLTRKRKCAPSSSTVSLNSGLPIVAFKKATSSNPANTTMDWASRNSPIMSDTLLGVPPNDTSKDAGCKALMSIPSLNDYSNEDIGHKTKQLLKPMCISNNVSAHSVARREQRLQPICEVQIQQSLNLKSGSSTTEILNTVLNCVLNWKTAWFEEQKRSKTVPPIVPLRDLIHAKSIYKSLDEYTKTYIPLILLETWAEMASSMSKRNVTFHLEYLHSSLLFDDDDDGDDDRNAMLMHFRGIVPKYKEDSEDFPQDGWIVLLQIPLISSIDGKKECINLLAYIEYFKKMPYGQFRNSGASTVILERLAATQKGEKILLTITLRTKKCSMNLNKDVLFKMTLITKFRKCLQLFKALASVLNSALGRALLDPQKNLCTLPVIDPKFRIMTGGKIAFNKEQENAIMRVTKACVNESFVPTVAMIHGPPGTGKTAVIAGLILELLYGANVTKHLKPLILLCAPSNNAVDEDIRRLQESTRGRLKTGESLKLVRLGQLHQVSEDVRQIHVDNLVHNILLTDSNKVQLQIEIEKVQTEIAKDYQKLQQAQQCAHIKEVNKLMLSIATSEQILAQKDNALQIYLNMLKKDSRKRKREYILVGADVIASTLGSCGQGGMEVFQKDLKRPIICIVDEATQCVEPDLLVILQYGITKLVLVGDPLQLPATVISQKAKELRYDQSLFERLYKGLKVGNNGPAILLEVQYRMHPEICQFPSMQFYNGRLVTDTELAKKMSHSQLVPYTFFNISDSREVMENYNCSNPNEVTFITRLVKLLLEKDSTLKIGIVTYYSAQKQLLIDAIPSFDSSDSVEINTVDGFQGREKEVIIVSTVRAQSETGSIGFVTSPNRLNVAITRARDALIICGYRNSLWASHHWKSLIIDAEKRRKLFTIESMASDSDLVRKLFKHASSI